MHLLNLCGTTATQQRAPWGGKATRYRVGGHGIAVTVLSDAARPNPNFEDNASDVVGLRQPAASPLKDPELSPGMFINPVFHGHFPCHLLLAMRMRLSPRDQSKADQTGNVAGLFHRNGGA